MDHLMCITKFQPSLKTSRMVSLVFIVNYNDITILTNLSPPDVLMFRTNLKSAPSKESKGLQSILNQPLSQSVIVLCFVVRYFMSILVLQSS